MSVRDSPGFPDFLIVGAPKAGTTALHAALGRHPQLYASPVKEPKYFLTGDRRPERGEHRGPGDAHSAREWIWHPSDYTGLFRSAPPDALRFESTPFYLWSRASHARIARAVPDAKLVVVVRDPVDRAFSNWTHLRADGLEPEADFLTACRLESSRAKSGWAPFWRYLELGRYGEQLESLLLHFRRSQLHVIRYRELIDEPARTLDEVCEFLGVATGMVTNLPDANVGRWSAEGAVNDALRHIMRGGASLGAVLPPQVWRLAERQLVRLLQRGGHTPPRLDPTVRTQLMDGLVDDNALLCKLLDVDFSDWLVPEGRGTYTVRRS